MRPLHKVVPFTPRRKEREDFRRLLIKIALILSKRPKPNRT